MLLQIDHCSICVINGSIFSALLTISYLYGLISLLVSSTLSSCLSCSISCSIMFVFTISPVSTFLYMYLVCSLVKNCPTVGWSYLSHPPILESKSKNVLVQYLPFIHLKDSCNFVWDCPVYWLVNVFVLQLPDLTSVVIALSLFLP